MLQEAFLSFLGLGVQAPLASWGSLALEGIQNIAVFPWQLLFPGVTMAITLVSLNFFGDGLRDALDPQTGKDIVGTLLSVRGLKTYFDLDEGVVKAVDGVSFDLERGRTLGIVGESGSGKSVTNLSVLRLVPSPPGRIVAGQILFDGQDIVSMSAEAIRKIRGKRIAMIFQDPMSSLNPFMRISKQLMEMTELHLGIQRAAGARPRRQDAGDGRDPRRAHARQRLPARIFRRHASARDDRDGAFLRPGAADRGRAHHRARRHDSGADPRSHPDAEGGDRHERHPDYPRSWCRGWHDRRNRRDVCRQGVRERADRGAVRASGQPLHPGLLRSVPDPTSKQGQLYQIPGLPPDPARLPPGCPFAPRCEHVQDICRQEFPPFVELTPRHHSLCHFAQDVYGL